MEDITTYLTVFARRSMKYMCKYISCGTVCLALRTRLYAPSMNDCSSSTACLMQGFSNALAGSSSNSVWNSAILFCTRSLRRLRPKIGYSWGDGGITPLFKKKKEEMRNSKDIQAKHLAMLRSS